jgi:hypothetical protein
LTDRNRRELADRLMDTYVEWREECARLQGAYERWATATPCERPLAYAAFRAALDREERSSYVYADLVERLTADLAAHDYIAI